MYLKSFLTKSLELGALKAKTTIGTKIRNNIIIVDLDKNIISNSNIPI